MLFNSVTYFYFFIIVFVLYWFVLDKSYKWQNILLFAASYCFYGWWDVRFLVLIFISSIVDFFLGRAIYFQTDQKHKRRLLWLCMLINLGMLGFFKYFNFFIDSFSSLLTQIGFQPNIQTLQIILPVGISFYTFQSLSYSIDIYRDKLKPTNDFVSFMTFVSFFPQLVAGPIERASHLLPQFLAKRKFNHEQMVSGLRFILFGLFKKMVIADRLAYFVGHIYESPEKYDGTVILAATILFGFQIYCDFSGYSDIAIGSARLLGFDLMQNFRTPYLAKSFKDFWHRWHISLSSWFRDYVYIPLGGSHVSQGRWVFNILLTFTLSGLWHGAALSFVIWGFLHGVFLVMENFISKLRLPLKKIPGLGIIITFMLVNLNWIFFRAGSIDQSLKVLSRLGDFNLDFIPKALTLFAQDNNFRVFVISLLVGFPLFLLIETIIGQTDFDTLIKKTRTTVRWGVYLLCVFMILVFGVLNAAPQFIYFQF